MWTSELFRLICSSVSPDTLLLYFIVHGVDADEETDPPVGVFSGILDGAVPLLRRGALLQLTASIFCDD